MPLTTYLSPSNKISIDVNALKILWYHLFILLSFFTVRIYLLDAQLHMKTSFPAINLGKKNKCP